MWRPMLHDPTRKRLSFVLLQDFFRRNISILYFCTSPPNFSCGTGTLFTLHMSSTFNITLQIFTSTPPLVMGRGSNRNLPLRRAEKMTVPPNFSCSPPISFEIYSSKSHEFHPQKQSTNCPFVCPCVSNASVQHRFMMSHTDSHHGYISSHTDSYHGFISSHTDSHHGYML